MALSNLQAAFPNATQGGASAIPEFRQELAEPHWNRAQA